MRHHNSGLFLFLGLTARTRRGPTNARLASNLVVGVDTLSSEVTSQIAAGDFATQTQLKTGAGLPFAKAIATFTGSGTTDQLSATAISLPMSPVDEHEYEFNYSFNVTSSANAQLASVSVNKLRAKYDSAGGGSWTFTKAGDTTYQTETGWDTVFLSAANLPGLDVTGPDFKVIVRPIDAQVAKVTLDGVMIDLGQNHA